MEATMNPSQDRGPPEDYIYSTSEKSYLRAKSLFLIQTIVDQYGGTLEVDLANDQIHIDVPTEYEVECAQKVEEVVGNMTA
jgi:hypothetical protein